jgi:tetratricopeptide (TPR) repeat protein
METAFRKGLFLSKELGIATSIRFSTRNLGLALLRQGKYDQAWEVLLENINLIPNDEVGSLPLALFYLAGICLDTGQTELAGRLFGFAAPRVENVFSRYINWDRVEIQRVLNRMRACQDDPAFAAAWEQGKQMTLAQAMDLARHRSSGC